MTKDEAIQKIEEWLLIPVEYNKILPALAEIRSGSRYEEYRRKVADAEYLSETAVDRDVDAYISEYKAQAEAREKRLGDRLDEAAGGKRYKAPKFDKDDVILDLMDGKADLGRDAENEKRVEAVRGYMQHFSGNKPRSTKLSPRCPLCGAPLICAASRKELPNSSLVFAIIFFFVCMPISIFIIIFGRKETRRYRCPNCMYRSK